MARINNLEFSINNAFNDNTEISDEVLLKVSTLKHTIELALTNKIDKFSFSIYITKYIDSFGEIINNNQLSDEQYQLLNKITNICMNLHNELNDDDNDTEYSSGSEYSDSDDEYNLN